MAKQKKAWFSLIKRFFVSDSQSRTEKKEKKKRWVFRLLKMKGSAPPLVREKLPWQTTEHSSINTLPVIIAIDTPIPNIAQPCCQQKESPEPMGSSSHVIIPKLSRESASTKIQAAFRGYLARKALRALKGVVKLQALIRGWAVRQQAINTLKCLQSIVNIQSEVCSKRRETIKDSVHCQEHNSRVFRESNVKVHLNSQKRREDNALTKEELKDLIQTKREAAIKRERVKEYYLNHRRSAETERDTAHGRRRYWLEQWVDAQLAKSLTPTINSNSRNKNQAELLDSPSCNTRRTYHHRKQRSTGDDNLFLGSPSVPAYMASTESAKARARSMSSPRLRPLSFDACSETLSPYKHKLSPLSSINSEMTSSSWVGNHQSSSRRSPCLRGAPGPIKSTSHRHNC